VDETAPSLWGTATEVKVESPDQLSCWVSALKLSDKTSVFAEALWAIPAHDASAATASVNFQFMPRPISSI
jgi:hypothetical protein